jgi:hypothetical protein
VSGGILNPSIFLLLIFVVNSSLMSKKISKDINYFEDYHMLAIVSHLKDYTLCFHVNNSLGFDFVKYEDLIFIGKSGIECSFSCYYYMNEISRTTYYLIGNKGDNGILIPSQKTVDYFLLIKSPMAAELAASHITDFRNISLITAVFSMNMEQIKEMDMLLEAMELHELEYITRRKP